MRKPFALILLLSSSLPCAQAASVFWAFQTTTTGVGQTTDFTTNSGFAGTPSFTAVAGTGSAVLSSVSGGLNFTDPATGTTWQGDGTANTIGANRQWGTTATQNLSGAGFILGLNTTGLTDLAVRFDVRSASSSNGTADGQMGGITSFSSISYRTDGGAWIALSGVTMPTWVLQGDWQANKQVDLSAFSELENQSSLELQFIFNGGVKSTTNTPIQNMRMDNLLVTAVPEPSAAALALAGVLGFGLRRRR